ncbi:MAG: helix-turn-helix transcriptional regulator [Lachnospiraceae bacterium]|nr:helix-turn-helix transcriptional regulator [Lachnospiraceae bacterium]
MKEIFIGQRLKELRITAGISQSELNHALAKEPSYIESIESGERLPSLEMFLALCDWFGISPTEFFLPVEKDEDWIVFNNYRKLSRENKEQISQMIDSLSELEQKNSAGK